MGDPPRPDEVLDVAFGDAQAPGDLRLVQDLGAVRESHPTRHRTMRGSIGGNWLGSGGFVVVCVHAGTLPSALAHEARDEGTMLRYS